MLLIQKKKNNTENRNMSGSQNVLYDWAAIGVEIVTAIGPGSIQADRRTPAMLNTQSKTMNTFILDVMDFATRARY